MKRLSLAAQQEIEQLCDRHKGLLKPEEVVRFARNKRTALHNHFTWDDTAAAHQHRLWEARQVLRVYVTYLTSDPVEVDLRLEQPVRAFMSNPWDRTQPGGGYRRTVEILRNEEMREAQLFAARREATNFAQRYRHLQELADVIQAIDDFVAEGRPGSPTVEEEAAPAD